MIYTKHSLPQCKFTLTDGVICKDGQPLTSKQILKELNQQQLNATSFLGMYNEAGFLANYLDGKFKAVDI